MRQRRETPQPWADALERAQVRSLRHLSEKTGINVQTLTRLVHGEGTPSARTLDAVAAALTRADARHVPEWAGVHWRSLPQLPDAARQLTPKQWRAVERVIDSMADPGEEQASDPKPTRNDPPPVRHLRREEAASHQPVRAAQKRRTGANARKNIAGTRPQQDDPPGPS